MSKKMIPLPDEVNGKYLNKYPRGLWNHTNEMPSIHKETGLSLISGIQPMDTFGNLDSSGKIVFMTLGYSNMTQLMCCEQKKDGGWCPCEPYTFIPRAEERGLAEGVVLFNGARGSRATPAWAEPRNGNYLYIEDELINRGLSRYQVQAVVMKCALGKSYLRNSLPAKDADSYLLSETIVSALRAIKIEYPNCCIVYLMPRSYGGYDTSPTPFSGEPWAYEGGFAVKRVIQNQHREIKTGKVSATYGPLWDGTMLVTWGPYLWANGETPIKSGPSAGLFYETSDYMGDDGGHTNDYTHYNEIGRTKQADKVYEFFIQSPFSQWMWA